MQNLLPLPEFCARQDQGGGVTYGDEFIVFTKAQIPTWYLTQLRSSGLQDELTKGALAIARVIKIYVSRNDIQVQRIRSLPTGQPRSASALDQKPWFFLNAATIKPACIAIAGGGTMLEDTYASILLAVLSRPWCVLELCYSRTSSIDSLLAFVILACQLDAETYAPARILLSHERSHRVGSARTMRSTAAMGSFTLPSQRRKLNIDHVRELYAALFIVSENSYSGFWMRAVCVGALTMDLSFSLLGSALAKSTDVYPRGVRNEDLLSLVMERSFYQDPAINNDHKSPVSKGGSRAEILGTPFLQMSSILAEMSLPHIYRNMLRGITDMAV